MCVWNICANPTVVTMEPQKPRLFLWSHVSIKASLSPSEQSRQNSLYGSSQQERRQFTVSSQLLYFYLFVEAQIKDPLDIE